MLQAMAQEDDLDASELFFGGAYGIADGPDCPEAVAWRKRSTALSRRLAPLPRAEVRWHAQAMESSPLDRFGSFGVLA